MYKRRLAYLMIIPVVILTGSCSDVLSPAPENNTGIEEMYEDASYAEGFLSNAYNLMPDNGWAFTDVATDNAVTNETSNDYLEMATGQWTAANYPMNEWSDSRAGIQFVNLIIANSDSVEWASDPATRELFNERMKGEAYGLRAFFMYHLLKNHAGWTGSDQSGELLGVPIVIEPQDKDSDFQRPRDTFEAGMQQIYSDIEQARKLLPTEYGNLGDPSQLPDGYGSTRNDLGRYNRVFGNDGRQRMSGRIAMAIKAKAALLAASPAYNEGNTTTWEDAANYAGALLELNNGVAGLAPEGATWYDNADQISNMGSGSNPPEIIWRGNRGENTTLEEQHFPPTLYGDGWMNPTQSLVDAFPMVNGYPIDHPQSNYDESNPYQNRVPLLEEYVLVNGGRAGVNSTPIATAADGNTNDALNAVQTSTRTGYYLKKLLRQDVNLDPTSTNPQQHYFPRIRWTEIYLAYSEAANEAWGPMGTGGFSFSAYDVIEALRERQGINQPDQYMQNEIISPDDMRDLIRSVRRIELAFEDFRFWDLRRWNMDLTETADGVHIENGNHNVIQVERRDYQPYQRFGPVPRSEVIKFNLEQNFGW